MKQSFYLAVFLLIVMLVSPLLVFIPEKEENSPPPNSSESVKDGTFTGDKVTVLLTKTGEKITVSMEEYLIGSVAREMLPTYNSEALKAQAAVCRTYIEKMKKQEELSPTPELKGADVSDDSSVHQGYMAEKERREKFGAQFEAYEKKLREAVQDGGQHIITYNGEIITAAYCAISSGQTESAANIWGGDLPYLQPVQSAGDRLSPDFASTVALTEEEFKSKAKLLDGAVLGDNPDEWIGKAEVSDSGTVTKFQSAEESFQDSR